MSEAFCGDTYLYDEVWRLAGSVRTIVETGTYDGRTTLALADMADTVHTIEIDAVRYAEAREALRACPNVITHHGRSQDVLRAILPTLDKPCLYWLDAHWRDENPLLAEIELIAAHDPSPILAIHDMRVPNRPDLKYDTYNGQPYCFEWVEPSLRKLKCRWRHYYNDEANGQRVGVLFVVPCEP
ncbi:MAG: hypothetical protein WBK94_07575 [Tenuifilaceae bacterium]